MASRIRTGDVEIGEDLPVRFLAEGCDNHAGSLARAKEMAQAAKEAGADIIKFQFHIPDEEMAREPMIEASRNMFAKFGSLWEFVVERALTAEQHADLMAYCRGIGIQYLCTPFSLKAARFLKEMGAEGFKIGSGETEDLPMIERKTPFALLHCLSVYSSQRADLLNLGCIREMRRAYGVPVGFSDHTPPEGIKDPVVSQETILFTAVAMGACMVEKHFTLDRSLPDADSAFSLDPEAVRALVQTLRAAETVCRAERRVFDEEKPVHVWAKRSIVAATDIPKGVTVTRAMITSKRPGTGIRSKTYRETVLGKVAARDIPAGAMFAPDDLA